MEMSDSTAPANRGEFLKMAAGPRLAAALGLAVAFTLGFGAMLWSRQPNPAVSSGGLESDAVYGAIGSLNPVGQGSAGDGYFDRLRQLEAAYEARIERMLVPVTGPAGVRARVAVDLRPDAVGQEGDVSPARIKSLSAVVVVGAVAGAGRARDLPTDALTALIEKAVGYDAGRGDIIRTIRAPLAGGAADTDGPPVWEPLLPAFGAGMVALLLAWGFMRLVAGPARRGGAPRGPAAAGGIAGGSHVPGRDVADAGCGAPPAEPEFEALLERIQVIAKEDPGRVARVVRQWIASDD